MVNFCGEHNRDRSNKIWFSVVAPRNFCYEASDALTHLANVNSRVENALLHIPDDRKDLVASAKRALRVHQICTDGEFEIAVVAPMSSGKSTLINALLRTQLLQVGNMATTAKIVRIFDVDDADGFTYTCEDAEGGSLPMSGEATREVLRELNNNDKVFYVNIFGNVPGISAKYSQLRIIDTPGPDNSAKDRHREATYSIIRSQSHQPLVLFVRDATKLGDTSEYRLMSDVIESLKSSWLESERIIFVINRADQIDVDTEDISDFVCREKEFIEDRFGVHAPLVIPICARASILQSLADTSDDVNDEREYEISMLQNKLSHTKRDLVAAAEIPQEYKETIAAQKRDAIRSGDTSMITQINSGIYGLELVIDDYLKKYAIPFKVRYYGKIMHDSLAQIKQYVDESEVEAKNKYAENITR